MRKNLYISFLLVAFITMMAHSFVPHHEHNSKICFEKIDCNNSDTSTEKEATHACCLEKQDIIRPENNIKQNQLCSHGTMCDVHFPPIILFLGDFFAIDTHDARIEYKPYINLYTSADVYSANFLRGPPQA